MTTKKKNRQGQRSHVEPVRVNDHSQTLENEEHAVTSPPIEDLSPPAVQSEDVAPPHETLSEDIINVVAEKCNTPHHEEKNTTQDKDIVTSQLVDPTQAVIAAVNVDAQKESAEVISPPSEDPVVTCSAPELQNTSRSRSFREDVVTIRESSVVVVDLYGDSVTHNQKNAPQKSIPRDISEHTHLLSANYSNDPESLGKGQSRVCSYKRIFFLVLIVCLILLGVFIWYVTLGKKYYAV